MKSYIKLFTVALVSLTFINCKNNEVKLSEYKYLDKTLNITCTQIDSTLIKEAVLSFEDDISNHFMRNETPNLSQAYSRIINYGIYGKAPYRDMVSDHTKEIFDALKTNTDLWITKDDNTTLNYNHPYVLCLAENIKDKDINTTFNALLNTNSMRQDIFAEAFRRKSSLALRDKYLATYIALDLYFAKLFNVDFNQPKSAKPAQNKNQNLSEPKLNKQVKKADPHAGHNH